MALRDYDAWHTAYDDPESALSWRLATVRGWIAAALDAPARVGRTEPFRVISLCAGDGRDVLGVLADRVEAGRADADRVEATLIEVEPTIADRARAAAGALGIGRIEVRQTDAGVSDTYVDLPPADLVLLVGIFGNIMPADIERLIRWAPRLCAPGATLLWSRGRHDVDLNDTVRGWFAAAGFTELAYAEHDAGSLPAAGAMRYDGGPAGPVVPGEVLFTFVR